MAGTSKTVQQHYAFGVQLGNSVFDHLVHGCKYSTVSARTHFFLSLGEIHAPMLLLLLAIYVASFFIASWSLFRMFGSGGSDDIVHCLMLFMPVTNTIFGIIFSGIVIFGEVDKDRKFRRWLFRSLAWLAYWHYQAHK